MWLWAVLAGCDGGGAIGPEDDSYTHNLYPTEFPVVFSDDGLFAATSQQSSGDGVWHCYAQISNLTRSAYGSTADVGGSLGPPCAHGPSFDAASRVFLRGDSLLMIGAPSGPYATFVVGAPGACRSTRHADGAWVTCAGTDLVAVSTEGAEVFRVGVGGEAVLGLVCDDADTTFAVVRQPDLTHHLVAVSATGGVTFDVPIGEVQDDPSLDDEGAVVVSVITEAGPAIQVFDPGTGEVLREVALDGPSLSVLIADDGDWVVSELGYVDGALTGQDLLSRRAPDGTIRWSATATNLRWPILDDRGRVWVSADDEVHVLGAGGDEKDVFLGWGAVATTAPTLHHGWYGAVWDGYGRVASLMDTDATLATTGWPRVGGSNRNDGRRP